MPIPKTVFAHIADVLTFDVIGLIALLAVSGFINPQNQGGSVEHLQKHF